MPAQSIRTGTHVLTLEIQQEKLVSGPPPPALPPISDLPKRLADLLESPTDFPPLRRALTPDDHVAILIQEDMNSLPVLLQALLLHIFLAGIKPENVTLLVPSRGHPASSQRSSSFDLPSWLANLPDQFQACKVEEHRYEASHIAYLANTRQGRRIYLNRTLVDADQIIILSPVRFDPIFGVATGLAYLFPTFSDEATRQELLQSSLSRIGSQGDHAEKTPAIWQEALAVGWLLGMPFVIAVLEGSGDDVLAVWSGGAEAVRQEADARLREARQFSLSAEVDLVIGTIGSLPEHQSFVQVAAAAARASRVTRSDGAVAILSEVRPELPRGAETMQHAPDPSSGLSRLRQDPRADWISWWQLATALEKNKLYLHSQIPAQTLEDLWIIPIEKMSQVQNLINQARTLAIIEDLHRSMPMLRDR
jgi:nickel-dependent lactate racemase